MRIAVTGTRGIPNVQGGVETHCEQLFPLIAAKGHEVILFRRDSYVGCSCDLKEYKGVRLCNVSTPKRKSLEAIVHTLRCVWKAKCMKADILHIHAIGPALLTPMARLMGMKVIVTHHGPDYEREKWGKAAKFMLRFGERMGARWGNKVIVISKVIDKLLKEKYGNVPTKLIYNGVPEAVKTEAGDFLNKLGVESQKFILAVGRFVPEKNFHQLIEAYDRLSPLGYKLVIAGDADIEDDYSLSLKRLAKKKGVVLAGFVKGRPLRELLSNASLFVLPSSHEGLPISLLEAMSYGRDVLVSDIPANTIDELNEEDFFKVGDVESLRMGVERKLKKAVGERTYDLSKYSWEKIADQTETLYKEVLGL